MGSEVLQHAGLSLPEIKVFEALLRLGTSSSGKIIKESGVPSSHVYDVLDKLIKKGLVTYHISKNVRRYEAGNPETILTLYEKRKKDILKEESELKKKVQEFMTMSTLIDQESRIRIYEGLTGIKSSIEKMLTSLKKNETYYVIGSPRFAGEKLNAFFRDVHERRIKKGIRFAIIYNASAKVYAEERKKSPLTSVKISDIDTPAEICMYRDTVQIIMFSHKPILIEVNDAGLAKSFHEYFNVLWKFAKDEISDSVRPS